jgi:hypothetical protein
MQFLFAVYLTTLPVTETKADRMTNDLEMMWKEE